MALTIKPDAILDGVGYAVVVNDTGDPVGAATVRVSETMPGHIMLVASCELGKAVRVPCDWLAALECVPELDAPKPGA